MAGATAADPSNIEQMRPRLCAEIRATILLRMFRRLLRCGLIFLAMIASFASLRSLHARTTQVAPKSTSPETKIEIAEVKFGDSIQLPKAGRDEVIRLAQSVEAYGAQDWLMEFNEMAEEVWKNFGYWEAIVTADSHLLSSNPDVERYSVLLHANEGIQYHIGSFTVTSANAATAQAFSEKQWRQALELHEGEVADMQKVRRGIQALTKLYSTKGYMDFTVTPTFTVDRAQKCVDIELRLDEEQQYRVGNVEIRGLNDRLTDILRGTLKVGEPFNASLVEQFFERYKLDLPPGAELNNVVRVERDPTRSLVNLHLDFRPRSEPQN
jgi:hypothetical protein